MGVRRHSFELLFVNNGTDASDELLRALYSPSRILPSRGNIGFASANNYLAEHASGRWLLLLNPDTELQPGAIDLLLDAAHGHLEYQALGGVTVDEDGRPGDSASIVLPSFSAIMRGFLGRAATFSPAGAVSGLIATDALSGGFMMVEGTTWREMRGLDADFFLYAEELDFFKRLKDRGGKAAQVIASRVYHDVGSGEVFSPSRMRFKITGRAHYLRKHFSAPYAYACLSLIWLTLASRLVGGRLLAWKNRRYARMADAYTPLVRAPWTWWHGYSSPGADPRRTPDRPPSTSNDVPGEKTR